MVQANYSFEEMASGHRWRALRERGRIETGETYRLNYKSEIQFAVEKTTLRVLRREQLRMVRGGLNNAVGLCRIVMAGVALGRVGVRGCSIRLGGGFVLARRKAVTVNVIRITLKVVVVMAVLVPVAGLGQRKILEQVMNSMWR